MAVALKDLKLKSMLRTLQSDDNLRNALLVFFGSLCVLMQFPFYPWPIAIVLAVVCGGIAYKLPPLGTLASLLVAIPAASYQNPLYGWMFMLGLGFAAFESFNYWNIISYLEIVVFLPLFTAPPMSLLSGFVFLMLATGSLFIGSTRSRILTGLAIYLTLLFSTLWNHKNVYFPIQDVQSNYKVEELLLNNKKPEVGLFDVPGHIMAVPGEMLSTEAVEGFNLGLGKIWDNTMHLFFGDVGLLHIAFFVGMYFLIAWLPQSLWFAQMGIRRNQQTAAALLLLLIPLWNLGIGLAYGYAETDSLMVLLYVCASIGIIYFVEQKGVVLARDVEARKKDDSKAFGGGSDLDSSVMSLDDIGNYEDVKKELRDAIVLPLENKEISYAYDLKPPKGILFFGPPGTGKTMMMKALSRQLRFNFDYVKSSDLLSEWYGESEKNVVQKFDTARKKAPCILFFDEIDSFAKNRLHASNDEVGPRILNTFLQEMDGFKAKKNVIIIGATNVPHQLDPAILRPGRFDKLIYMPLPDLEGREKIFELYFNKLTAEIRPVDIDVKKLARKTERFSGADIKNIIDEAVRLTATHALEKGEVIPLSSEVFELVLKNVKPSVSLAALDDFEKFRMDFERRVSTKGEPAEKQEALRWDDVVGLEGVKQLVKEAIEYPLLHEDELKKFDVKPMKGVLMFGPPGCGKTMLVKAAANELKAQFLYVSCAEVSKNGYTYMANAIKDIFTRAREQAPCVVFMDEIEAIASARSMSASPAVSQLLTEMDGIKELKNVVVIGATNVPEIIDRALLRPGRFDRVILIPPPDAPARREMFRKMLKSVPQQALDLDRLAALSEGYSGADIAAVCQDVKMEAVRRKIKGMDTTIATKNLENAIASRGPSISANDMARYMKVYAEFTGNENLKRELSGDDEHSHYR